MGASERAPESWRWSFRTCLRSGAGDLQTPASRLTRRGVRVEGPVTPEPLATDAERLNESGARRRASPVPAADSSAGQSSASVPGRHRRRCGTRRLRERGGGRWLVPRRLRVARGPGSERDRCCATSAFARLVSARPRGRQGRGVLDRKAVPALRDPASHLEADEGPLQPRPPVRRQERQYHPVEPRRSVERGEEPSGHHTQQAAGDRAGHGPEHDDGPGRPSR